MDSVAEVESYLEKGSLFIHSLGCALSKILAKFDHAALTNSPHISVN